MRKSRFYQFDKLITLSGKSIQKIKKKYMDKYGLAAAHTDCLIHLYESPAGLTQSDLVDLEDMDKAQISRVLKVLIQKGYVYTASSGYKQPYLLTESGREIAKEIHETILNINIFVSKELSIEDLATFYKTFEIITQNIRQVEQSNKNTFRKEDKS